MQENNIIKLSSRYKDIETTFKQLDSNSGIITTNSNYTRHILSEDNKSIKAIDFEGGPMLHLGDTLNNKKIKSIEPFYNGIYNIQLE